MRQKLYGYLITVRCDVYHGDEFSHSVKRRVITHDPRMIKYPTTADFRVDLNPGKDFQDNGIRKSDEYIASVDFLGRVRYRTEVYYDDECC